MSKCSISESTISTLSESQLSRRKTNVDDEKEDVPKVGYTLEELEKVRSEPKWKTIRILSMILLFGIWAGFLAGSIVIIILNKKDSNNSTTTIPPMTTTAASFQLKMEAIEIPLKFQ